MNARRSEKPKVARASHRRSKALQQAGVNGLPPQAEGRQRKEKPDPKAAPTRDGRPRENFVDRASLQRRRTPPNPPGAMPALPAAIKKSRQTNRPPKAPRLPRSARVHAFPEKMAEDGAVLRTGRRPDKPRAVFQQIEKETKRRHGSGFAALSDDRNIGRRRNRRSNRLRRSRTALHSRVLNGGIIT